MGGFPGLRGIWAAAVTPVLADLSPAPRLFAEHVRRLLAEGCHGVLAFGTTGEAASFSVGERRAMLDALLEAGLPPDRLLVGVGCCALPDTLELARHAAASRCAGLLVMPPFFYKEVSPEGLFRSFAMLMDALPEPATPVLLYHFPRLSQVPIPPQTLARLAGRYPGVVAGLKDSSGDAASLRAFLEAAPGLAVFPGTETLLLDGLRAGAAGVISAGANLHATQLRELFDAFEAGRPGLERLQERITALREAIQRRPVIPAIKRILADRTGERAWATVRPPLTGEDDSTAPAR